VQIVNGGSSLRKPSCLIFRAAAFYKISIYFFAALELTGCTIVDRFSDRAVQYNKEAEQIQDQDVLLNVVRASKRRPLEFTGITTATGTA
jgi:hypothetical protein